MSPVSFKGKVVLVTGAGSIIGAEVASHFSKLGATLVLTDSDKSRLNKVNESCGNNCLLIAAELTKNEDVLGVFNQTIARFKKLDVLINYAGTGENGYDDAASLEHYDLTMNLNVRVIYHVTLLAAPHLVKTNGNIVNVSVLGPGRSTSHILNNSVSRSALEELTKCVAMQLMSDGVRVNAVSPDMIDTHLNAEDAKSYGMNNTSERTGRPKDVADAVVFLASDCAAFITGANLPVDGGRHLSSKEEDVNRNLQCKEDTKTKSVVESRAHRAEASCHEIQKGDPVCKQKGNVAPAHKQDGKGDQDKREEHKEQSSKSTPTKQDTTDLGKSSAKQEADKNHHSKPLEQGH